MKLLTGIKLSVRWKDKSSQKIPDFEVVNELRIISSCQMVLSVKRMPGSVQGVSSMRSIKI